jgi:hypothetical protein
MEIHASSSVVILPSPSWSSADVHQTPIPSPLILKRLNVTKPQFLSEAMSYTTTTLVAAASATMRSVLLGELGLPHLVTPQDNVEHPLHVAEQLLVRCRSTALEVGDDGRCAVALCGQILLCHGRALVVLRLGARLGDGLADLDANGLGLDDIIRAVDFGEALTF